MQTTLPVTTPSTKAPSAARKAVGPDSGAGPADAEVGVFADLIAQAGEKLEAAKQPSASDALSGLLALASGQQQKAAAASDAASAGDLPPLDRGAAASGLSASGSALGAGRAARQRSTDAADAAAAEIAGTAKSAKSREAAATVAHPTAAADDRGAFLADSDSTPREAPGANGNGVRAAGAGRHASGANLAALALTAPQPGPATAEIPGRGGEGARGVASAVAGQERLGPDPAAAKANAASSGLAAAASTATAASVASAASLATAASAATASSASALPLTEPPAHAAAAALAAAATRPTAADMGTADRGARTRVGSGDVAATGRGRGSANRADAAVAAEAAGAADLREASTLAKATELSTAEAVAKAAGAAAAATSVGDASVFALTMNQLPANGTLATNRLDMTAHGAQAATQATVDVPVDHPGFSEAFARQSASLVIQGSSSAEIRLTPQDMGPIRIAISMLADGVSLDIAAANAETRAAIEASLPALRQMLADDGVRLSDWRLGTETVAGERSAGAGEAFRRQGESAGGNGEPATTSQQRGEPSHAGNSFSSGRGAGQFGRHGSGWTGGVSAPTAGIAGPQPGPDGGRSSLDLYA